MCDAFYFHQNTECAGHFSDLKLKWRRYFMTTQPAITCLKLTIETLEQGVIYVQS